MPRPLAADLPGPGAGIAGLAMTWTWGLASSAYHVEAIRAHFEGMTSFAPLAALFAAVLFPLWAVLYALTRQRAPAALRPAAALGLPTLLTAALCLLAIWFFNRQWMQGPDY